MGKKHASFYSLKAVVLLLCLPFLIGVAHAQVLYGSIVGNVRDASDAAVAGAVVSIANAETNFTREAVTNESGAYDLVAVPAGTYSLKVTKSGFTPYMLQGLLVTINTVSRADVSLKIGALTESVTVAAEAAVLQTDRS